MDNQSGNASDNYYIMVQQTLMITMKTLKTTITILFLFVCSLSFAQPVSTDQFIYKGNEIKFTALETASDIPSLTFTSKSYLLWQLNNKTAPFRSWLNTRLAGIEAKIGGTSPAPVDMTAVLNRLAFLEAEVKRLREDSTTIFVKGLTGTGTLEFPLTSLAKGRYTTTERDAAYSAGSLMEGDIIYNLTTAVLQVRNKTGWKNL